MTRPCTGSSQAFAGFWQLSDILGRIIGSSGIVRFVIGSVVSPIDVRLSPVQPHDVQWLESDETTTVSSVAQLDDLFDRLHRESEHPILASVSGPIGQMTIGLAHTLSILTFVYDDCDPPYPISFNGTDDMREHDFMMCGHHSAFAGKFMISNELARQAMRVFVQHGALSLAVRWAEG